MPEVQRPYSRSDYNRALVRNALLSPFPVLLFATLVAAGIVLGLFLPVLLVAIVAYGAAAARTYFDQDVANKVLEGERSKRRKTLEKGRLDPSTMAPPIRDLLNAGLQREARIRQAIERAEMPYDEVSTEVDSFISAMQSSAARAELLYEALTESPPSWIEQRLGEVKAEKDPGKQALVDALTNQLQVAHRMEAQLRRFYDEMERLLVELDTVRGSLVSASASTDAANQEKLADDVRGLREEVGSLAEGMSVAYEKPAVPPEAVPPPTTAP
jgi:chromosome segregation ATPase